MQTSIPARQARRATTEHRGQAHAPSNNERQLLARIAQLERAVRLQPAAVKPTYLTGARASSFGDGPDFGRYHEDSLSGLWAGHEHLTDQQGRRWSRFFKAVIDDFGNLVEVSA